jgi:hypothetical protein
MASFGAVSAASCSAGGPPKGIILGGGDGGTVITVDGSDDGLVTSSSSSSGGASSGSSSGAACTQCGARCVDLETDPENCGACAQPCGTGISCVGGMCLCPTGQTLCNKTCVDLTKDPSNCGFCGHNCQSSTCTAGLCPTTSIGNADQGQILADMTIDSTNAYWSWQAPDAPMPTNGGVTHKPFAGGEKQILFLPYCVLSNNLCIGDIRGIWVDSINVYATDILNGAVFAIDLPNGFSSNTVYQPPQNNIDGGAPLQGSQPVAITSDSTNVYWVDYALGTVMRARIDGSDQATALATGRNRPIRAAVLPPAGDGFVYWVDFGVTAGSGSVNKVSVNGGAVTTLATGVDSPRGIATDGTNVYWTSGTNTGAVSKVSVNGGAVTVLAQNQGGPWAIVVDTPDPDAGVTQTFVYWTNFNDNNIQKVPTTNTGPSTPFVLASQQNNPVAIAIDAKAVYWANQGDGSLWKVAR